MVSLCCSDVELGVCMDTVFQVGAGQPHCIDEPQPANCDNWIFGVKANNCSQYCSEVLRFVTAPRPGAWHDPDSESAGQRAYLSIDNVLCTPY